MIRLGHPTTWHTSSCSLLLLPSRCLPSTGVLTNKYIGGLLFSCYIVVKPGWFPTPPVLVRFSEQWYFNDFWRHFQVQLQFPEQFQEDFLSFSSFIFSGKRTVLVTDCKRLIKAHPYYGILTIKGIILWELTYIHFKHTSAGLLLKRVVLPVPPHLHNLCLPTNLSAVAFIQLHKDSYMYTIILHMIFAELVFNQISSLIQVTAQIFVASTGKVIRTCSSGQRKERVRLSVSVEACILVRLECLWDHSHGNNSHFALWWF